MEGKVDGSLEGKSPRVGAPEGEELGSLEGSNDTCNAKFTKLLVLNSAANSSNLLAEAAGLISRDSGT